MSLGLRLVQMACALWLFSATVSAGQAPVPATPSPAPDAGIPITSAVVRQSCGGCHPSDDKQRMSRISYRRTTPEGWQNTIRRMVSLNKARLDPQAAREVVKYLSNNNGLAPEELAPASFEVERRLIDWKYSDADTEDTCNRCHSLGRVIAQRRTRAEWEGVISMHRGWYPLVDFQAFRRGGPPPRDPGPDGRPADKRQPMEKAIDHLSKAFPLMTPEWSAWSASARAPRIEGTWAISGWDPGKGAVVGRVAIAAVAGATDEFTTTIAMTYPRTGDTVSRTGRVTVYTGFQWRGRSTQAADDRTALREVMAIDRDWQGISGRWFTGGYDELGIDVRLTRLSSGSALLGTSRQGLRTGVAAQPLTIYGANLPTSMAAADIDLGPGVTVSRVVSATADAVSLSVDVASTAGFGPRDIFVAGAARPKAVVIYDRIDTVKVAPDWSMARVGGALYPKMLAQFEAWGFHRGLDGKVGTADDIKVDVVPATWGVEEYATTFDDDDTKFVGTIDAKTGLFTPNIEGPNLQRTGSRNNIGDVWVVATVAPDVSGAASGAAIKARAHLLVTVPLYQQWTAFGEGTK